jgi:hypothetical protein
VPVAPPAPPGVVVHLPPDLVDQLVQPPDWWYTNGATVVTAVIAALAALLAYLGIVKQISSNQANVTRQINAENRRRWHEVRVALVDQMNDLAYDVHVVGMGAGRAAPEVLDRLHTRVMKLEVKLRLYNMRPQSDGLKNLWHLVVENAVKPQVEEAYRQLLHLIKIAIPGLENSDPDER